MFSSSIASWTVALLLASPIAAQKNAVSSAVYSNLLRYQAYSSAAYANTCATPPFGSSVLTYYNDATTDTQGTLFKDSGAKQIILAFRGTSSPADLDSDLNFLFAPLKATGTSCSACQVHTGFQNAYNAVSSAVISSVKSALAANKGYTLVVTGHSLGGGIASIAAASLAAQGLSFPVYTYGEPRNGNSAYTTYINGLIPVANYYRVTHANDGVPQIPPTILGFQHHGTEYWESSLAANTLATTYQCPGIENPSCNNGASFGTNPINGAHISYGGSLIGNSLYIAACGAGSPIVNPNAS